MTRRRAIEIVVILFGLGFMVYLATSFRPGRRPHAAQSGEAVPQSPPGEEAGQATTVLKGFDYTETVRGKPLFHIQSERTIGFGPAAGLLPNLYSLEKVTLTVYPEEGTPITVHADRATYDHRSNGAHLNGNVRWVDARGALGETEEIVFQPSARILSAPKALRLSRGTFVLEAKSGDYDVAKREARLAGPIHGTGTGEGTGGVSSLSADGAVYRRDGSLIELSGAVSGTTVDGNRVQADRMILKMGEEGQHFEWGRAEGHVHGMIAAGSLPRTAPAGPAAAQGVRAPRPPQSYAGDRAGLLFAPDGALRALSLSGTPATVDEPTRKLKASNIEVALEAGRARTATARGAVKIESGANRGESDEAAMVLTADGEIESLELNGSVKMEGEGRSGRADHAVQVVDRDVWVLTGSPGRSATVEGDGSKVSASRIEIDQKRKGVRAEGTARVVLTPRQNGTKLATPVGDSSRPTFGKADRMTFDDGSRVATFSGSAMLWQDASSVFGNDITVNDTEHTLVAVGNTRTVFTPAASEKAAPTPTAVSAGKTPRSPAGPGGADRHPSVITARRLVYKDTSQATETAGTLPTTATTTAPASTAHFDEHVVVTSAEWRATSSQATAWIGKDRRLDRVELTGGVVFQDSKEGRNGKAEHATDWPRDGKTILEGSPAFVIDREGNRVAGATLTISKRGGSVEVTAPEGGRTETIHKTRTQ